jgi:hypothetical protein
VCRSPSRDCRGPVARDPGPTATVARSPKPLSIGIVGGSIARAPRTAVS